MLPVQEISISTENRRLFSVHLEYWDDHFECVLAAIDLGPKLPADTTFRPYGKAPTALGVFRMLIEKLLGEISRLDPTDSIAIVDNPCNTEFINAEEQRRVAGPNVIIKVNGAVT